MNEKEFLKAKVKGPVLMASAWAAFLTCGLGTFFFLRPKLDALRIENGKDKELKYKKGWQEYKNKVDAHNAALGFTEDQTP
eukprot:Nk52_evm76s1737 gene=Nk52_evmTU76s1737